MLTQMTKHPGEFRARCRLGVVVLVKKATPEQRAEAAGLGLQRRHLGFDSRGKDRFGWLFPACDGFETDDREAYAAHLDEFHNGGVQKLKGPWRKIPAKLWTGPRLSTDGDDAHLRGRPNLRVCSCGLTAQVEGNAGELWWTEHVTGCELAQVGAAS